MVRCIEGWRVGGIDLKVSHRFLYTTQTHIGHFTMCVSAVCVCECGMSWILFPSISMIYYSNATAMVVTGMCDISIRNAKYVGSACNLLSSPLLQLHLFTS